MSTKIYYGFQIDTTDLHQVLALVKEFRKKHWEKDAKEHKIWFVSSVVSALEDPSQKTENGFTGYTQAEFLWMDHQRDIKKTGMRNRAVDTDFQIVLFPQDSRFIGIAYTEHSSWFHKFLRMPGVSEYGYWNNTDPPDNVSDEEWDERRLVWDKVLDGPAIPSMQGFTIDISDPSGPGFVSKEEYLTKEQMRQIIETRKRESIEDEE